MWACVGGSTAYVLVCNNAGVCIWLCVTGTGVTANAVHPGVVATELGRHTGLHQSQFSSSVLSECPASLLDSEV